MGSKEPFISLSICSLKVGRLIIIWSIFIEEQLEVSITVFCTVSLP